MKVESIRALRGPNRWSDEMGLEALLVCDDLELRADRLAALVLSLPSSLGRRVSELAARSSAVRLVPDLVAELASGLQRAAGSEVSTPRVDALLKAGEFRLLLPHREEEVGRRALDLAVGLVHGEIGDVAAAIAGLRKIDENVRLGPSTGSIVRAAEARGIPARRLTDGSLVQLGQGTRQHRIWAAETDATGAIAESIAQDKELTKSLLTLIGVPVPEGRPVASAEEAWRSAELIGLPVVVKPRKSNQGRGVSVALSTREQVLAAFEIAFEHGGEVLVERHVAGKDFRFLVVGSRLVAAARRDPPEVQGDGRHSIRELVTIENQDPRRGEDHATALSKLRLDAIAEEILLGQGLTADSVPEAGRTVLLRRNANLSTGGTAADVTDEVHPEVARCVVETAKMVGLDIAGIDVVAPRIDLPLEATAGAIIEVNAAPGLRMHLEPSRGKPRAVGEAIIDSLFAPGENGRIPVVAVTGTNGKTTTTRCIAHLLQKRGLSVGMTCTDGIYIDGRRIDSGDCSGPKSARLVLSHPEVEAAVLETARGGLLREGLGFDWCDVAVVTNLGEGDHLGLNGVHTLDELAEIKAIPVRRVSPRGAAVLNADDPRVAAMAGVCPGSVIFFSRDPGSRVVAAHRARGGRAALARDGLILLALGKDEWRVARLEQLPLTHGGRVGFQVENLLAALGAGFFLDIPLYALRSGLETFSSDVASVPGRFNVLNHRNATIILDYGHNVSALWALVAAIEQLPHRRRVIVYTAAGDRRDEDIVQQAAIIGANFDEIYIYEDQCTRGRAPGEVIRLMCQGFSRVPRRRRVLQASGELCAIGAAIAALESGDLLLCQVDQIDMALEFVNGLLQQSSSRSVASMTQFAAAAFSALVILG